jgi:hypothetical protein
MVILRLLQECIGSSQVKRPQFRVAVLLLRSFIDLEGSVEVKAAANQVKTSTIERKTSGDKELSFENRPEDKVTFDNRVEYLVKRKDYKFIARRNGKDERAFATG